MGFGGYWERAAATAATLEVTAPDAVDLSQGISGWAVKVTNNTGHKLPTGYSEGRVMWLEVTGRYNDEVVYSSGRWVDGQGLEADPQLRTYEGNAVEHASKTRFHLLRNNTWLVDSRIPPKGLKKDVETDPVGERYALLGDSTWAHYDEVGYEFAAASVVDATPGDPSDDTMTLAVRLLYVINTPEYVEFLADENRTNDAGQHVADLFGMSPTPQPPLELASWSQTVPLQGLMQPADSSSSGEPGSESGAPTTGETPTSGPGSSTGPGSTSTASSTSAGSETGTTEQEGEGGGCGCRSGSGGLGLLGAPGLLLLRRRRLRR